MKKIISYLISVPAIIMLCSEAPAELFGMQLAAGAIVFGILVWNDVINFNERTK